MTWCGCAWSWTGSAATARDTTRAWEAVEQAVIGKTMNLLVHFEKLP
jgi:hypothetical protein